MKGQPLATLPRPVRSAAQCRYLNGVALKMLCDHIGYERHEMNSILCGMFFGAVWVHRHGEAVCIPLRTTTTDYDGAYSPLEPGEFAEFVAFVQRFGARQGCVIPDPNKQNSSHPR